jgi:murein DD-endopeptidase MepM/ murein hydrolase activator NlpD
LALLMALPCAAPAAGAAARARRRPASRPVSLDVRPTPDIDAHVASEVERAKRILESLNTENLLSSPYLVSAIYYHDGFLSGFPADRTSAAPERRIIAQIADLLTRDGKAHFVGLLHDLWARSGATVPRGSAPPVVWSASGGGRRSHRYAIDLFAPEGAPVRSVSRGIVVLADRDWSPDDLFSTTSRKGGNAVIVFDPDRDRFYRYCHMKTVSVAPGDVVAAGRIVGSVGHTGLNASQPGHGHHLHFEANEYRDGRVKAIAYPDLRVMLRSWRSTPLPARAMESQPAPTRGPGA